MTAGYQSPHAATPRDLSHIHHRCPPKSMFPLCCLVLLSCGLPHGGSSLASTDSGPSVLIPLGLQTPEPPFLVLWMKGRTLLGRIHRGQCTYGCSEMSSVFPNGSLFLIRVRREDEGTYMADVFNASGILIHHAEIGLQVVDVSSDHMIDLSLENGSPGRPQHFVWRKGEENIWRVYMGVCDLGCSERTQVFRNGSLLLRRVQKADEGLYSALVYDSSWSPAPRTHVFLYVNVSVAETITGRSLSLSSVIFIGVMVVSCLSVITFITLGRFLSNQRNQENRDNDKSSMSYIEVQGKSNRKCTEWSNSSNVRDSPVEMQELGVHEEDIHEVEALSTFQ